MNKKVLYLASLAILFIKLFLFSQNLLPEDRKGDWLHAGYLRFLEEDFMISKVNNVLYYGATNDGNDQNNNNQEAIMDAIGDRDTNGVTEIYFPSGTYKISSPIEIFDIEKIILRGDGSNLTRLIFNFNNENNKVNIYIKSSEIIGIENLYIEREDSTDFGDNIRIKATNCWVSGVESNKAVANNIIVLSSENIEIRGCHIHHPWNSGVGGHGYGVNLGSSTSKCLVENNIFNHLRHSVILSNGPSSNVIGYNYSTDPYTTEVWVGIDDWPSDMCLHGHPDEFPGPSRNLFEGNICAFMNADDAWDDNGPYNTYFRNRATYYGLKINEINDTQNIIANEVDDSDGQLWDGLWNAFDIESTENYVVGNTNFDPDPPEYPSPSDYSSDLSLYFNPDSIPDFLDSLDYWPPIGVVDSDHMGGGTIPAKIRWNNGGILTVAHPEHDGVVTIISSGNGDVTPEGVLAVCYDSVLSVTANAHDGYHFTSWSVTNGITVISDDETGEFKVTRPGTVSAHFAINQYAVTLDFKGNGTVSPIGSQIVNPGSDLSISAVPDAHYHFIEWIVTGKLTIENLTSPNTQVLNIMDNGKVTAHFAPLITHIITVIQGANGTIEPAGVDEQVIVDQADDQAFTITPEENYKIVDVKVDNQSLGAVSSYTFKDIMESHTITSSFDIATTIDDNNEDNGELVDYFNAIPNPVNKTADNINFLFIGAEKSTAELIIYDMIGNIVYKNSYNLRICSDNGKHIVFGNWNLRNLRGRKVSAGTYLAVLNISSEQSLKRFIVKIGIKSD